MLSTGIVATVVICESVLSEKTGTFSAIRIMDLLKVASQNDVGRFFVLTFLHRHSPMDMAPHALKVMMLGPEDQESVPVAEAPDHIFYFSDAEDLLAPGAFVLATEFNLRVNILPAADTYHIRALVNGEPVAQTPLTQRIG